MSRASRVQQRWDTYDYQRIVSASYLNGEIIVSFADGTEARVAPHALVAPNVPAPDWANVRGEEFHLVVPSPRGSIEIPWDVIRVHSDPAFDAFWAELAEEPPSTTKTSRVERAARSAR